MDILHVDKSFLIVNKPAGLATVAGGWEKDMPNLVNSLEAEFGKLWIVHRLDKVTSGVILFARTPAAHRTMSLLFETRAMHKTYHAILCGVPSWDEHTARHRLRPDVGHNHRTAIDHAHGKSALTHFHGLIRFASHALMTAAPETGRTHQVRAHAAALGFPLLGDTLYGAPATPLIPRPALHSFSLMFEFAENSYAFTAPYPDDFSQALDKLKAGR